MAPIEIRDPLPWKPSTASTHYLEGLVASGLLQANTDPERPVWISPGTAAKPKPPPGYIVSLARLHERGFGIPAGRFMRALCDHYEVELHNFGPNSISQAAVFVAVCEGYLGIEPHWDLWIHLFRGQLHTDQHPERLKNERVAVRAGGFTLQIREQRKHLYIPCTMTTNNQDWDKGWFYLRNDDNKLPPYTGKVLLKKNHIWPYGVSPAAKQDQLVVYLDALQKLATAGLTAADVILAFHQRRVLPLMERRLALHQMVSGANLEGTQMKAGSLPDEYAIHRARRSVDKFPDHPCAVVMRPEQGYLSFVSVLAPFPFDLGVVIVCLRIVTSALLVGVILRWGRCVSLPASDSGGAQRQSRACRGREEEEGGGEDNPRTAETSKGEPRCAEQAARKGWPFAAHNPGRHLRV